jgi:hypothetical protein
VSSADCPESYGTHRCSQLKGHEELHYCVCVKGEQRKWRTGAKASLLDYRPDLITKEHVIELRESGLIK